MSAIGGVVASIAALVHMGERSRSNERRRKRNEDFLSHERRKFDKKQANRAIPSYDAPRRYRNVGS